MPSTFTITDSLLSDFKRVWPCHGIPDAVSSIRFDFDRNGDLVDLEAFDDGRSTVDTADFDGPALVALSHDAQTLMNGGAVDWWAPYLDLEALKAEFRLSSSGDFYGNVMGWWFAVAGELYERGEDVPADWHYRVGAGGGRDLESYEARIALEATTEALTSFGALLSRAYGICKARGWDY